MNEFLAAINLVFKGMVIGMGKVVPGMSAGTMAVLVGLYTRMIEAFSHIATKDRVKRKSYLTFLGLVFFGALLSVIGLANVLTEGLRYFPVATMLFFFGLIIGSLPSIYKSSPDMRVNKKRVFIFICFFALMALISTLSPENMRGAIITTLSWWMYILSGMVAGIAMLVPGISGSFFLILLGTYSAVLHATSKLNIGILILLGIGGVIGILLTSNLVNFLVKRFPGELYWAIIGLVLGSLIEIWPGWAPDTEGFFGIFTLISGLGIALFFSFYKKKKLKHPQE